MTEGQHHRAAPCLKTNNLKTNSYMQDSDKLSSLHQT